MGIDDEVARLSAEKNRVRQELLALSAKSAELTQRAGPVLDQLIRRTAELLRNAGKPEIAIVGDTLGGKPSWGIASVDLGRASIQAKGYAVRHSWLYPSLVVTLDGTAFSCDLGQVRQTFADDWQPESFGVGQSRWSSEGRVARQRVEAENRRRADIYDRLTELRVGNGELFCIANTTALSTSATDLETISAADTGLERWHFDRPGDPVYRATRYLGCLSYDIYANVRFGVFENGDLAVVRLHTDDGGSSDTALDLEQLFAHEIVHGEPLKVKRGRW